MIINFSVKNFGSIKDEQTLSFEATNKTHLEEAYIVKQGRRRLLKIALLYGANASGKTTVLKALDFLRVLVLQPLNKKSDVLDFEPFLFVDDPLKENSKISIEFIQNGKRYSYKVVFSKEAVIHEELTFWNSYKANIYKRYTDTSKQLSEIEFGSTISVDNLTKKALETNTLWNNTVLGGFLKTNINIKELKEVVDWFGSTLMTTVQNNSILTIFASDLVEKSALQIWIL